MNPSIIIYALCIPLACVIGYLITGPMDFTTFLLLGGAFSLLMFPVLIRWHYVLMFSFWNASIGVFFFPGQPKLSSVLIAVSFAMSIFHRTLKQTHRFLSVPSITWPLIVLSVIVLVTIYQTGGFGGLSLGGGQAGAKRYADVLIAIIAYFALVFQRIPPQRRNLCLALFFLSGVTFAIGDLLYLVGVKSALIFALFPTAIATYQTMGAGMNYVRLSGVTFAGFNVFQFFLARFGLARVLSLNRPFLSIGFGIVVLAIFLGGYRSVVLVTCLIFAFCFYWEGLLKTRFFPLMVLGVCLMGTLMVAFADKLPWSVQRSLSFLPIKVHESAAADASGTLDWRLGLWKLVWPEVPEYLWKGKGFTFSASDYFLTQDAHTRGFGTIHDLTIVTGHYHSGFLTLIIPFSLFGLLAFLWFCGAALRVVYKNYKYGEATLKAANTLILAAFVARFISYFAIYGQFDLDLIAFTGLTGLSVVLNNGVRQRPTQELPSEPSGAKRPVRQDLVPA